MHTIVAVTAYTLNAGCSRLMNTFEDSTLEKSLQPIMDLMSQTSNMMKQGDGIGLVRY